MGKPGELRCTYCGAFGLEEGFVFDQGQASQGFLQWIPGRLERGRFGGAKWLGRRRIAIQAHCCPRCSHLELFLGV